MSEAQRAREAAMSVECKKDGISQLQSGNWKFVLTIAPGELPEAMMSAAPGTRYQAVFVEVDDTEQPVDRDDTPGKRAKKHFEAACQGAEFQEWVAQKMGSSKPFTHQDTRAATKQLMGITTASLIIAYPEKWQAVYDEFKYRNFTR